MEHFVEGQRWISEMEPELGLGTITGVEHRRVRVNFYGSDCERQYAIASAPLKRVRFRPGDKVKSRDALNFSVETVREIEGIIIYCGNGQELNESDLCHTISFSTPKERLANGLVDSNDLFNLRCHALHFRAKTRNSPVRGFTGGRIDLIGHQFYIAGEVSSRYLPRVLLSDEVGLGKTIEACLILHRLLLCERVSRVLILVPDSLVHQWFVELLRRFNLLFRIFNEEFCHSVESHEAGINPFLEDQLGICSIGFLKDEKRQKQILEAGWDMVVVDEAHHLVENSPEYLFAEALGQRSKGLMLLTATPEQLGERSHFAHLRLLDPARYYDFHAFSQSAERYGNIAETIDKILKEGGLEAGEIESAASLLADGSGENRDYFKTLLNGGTHERKQLMEEILDRHGTGRVIFRNTRAAIKGFPGRVEKRHPLEGTEQDAEQANRELMAEINGDREEGPCDYTEDPRTAFLVDLIQSLKGEKILLICRSVEKSLAIEKAVRKQINVKIALFNETMTLIQRDRNAAWFAEKEGAQLLICSEIGSEGRNFQFAHHLVMFDLPLNPELLEQRIGRLDRIGQTRDIQIHIPYVANSAWEIPVRWYSEGLGMFEKSVNGLHHIFKAFGPQVADLAMEGINGLDHPETTLDDLIKETGSYRVKLAQELEKGRDRLLELNSFRPGPAKQLTDEIASLDENRDIDRLMLRMFDHYGIQADEAGKRTWRLQFDDISGSEFPVPPLRKSKMTVTFDRKTALGREEIDFLSRDNPMVTGAMELLLGTEQGNSALALWKNSSTRGLLLEAFFVPECVAPAHLQIDRFLPEAPIRIVVDHSGQNVTDQHPFEQFENCLENLPGSWLSENPIIAGELLPGLIEDNSDKAENQLQKIIESGVSQMESTMEPEIRRVKELRKVNPEIRKEEIELMEWEREALRKHLLETRLRLDAVRFVLLA